MGAGRGTALWQDHCGTSMLDHKHASLSADSAEVTREFGSYYLYRTFDVVKCARVTRISPFALLFKVEARGAI